MMQKFTKRQKLYFSLIANIIFPLAGVSTDIYLPSLPAMSQDFSATKAMLQLTVTSFLIAIAVGQFIAGPISDAYGRKKPLIISIIVQLLATVGILFASSVSSIIFWRFVQGFGSAFMMVPARAIMNDVFDGEALKRQFNYSTISFAIAPIVAPYIGGYFQSFFGWQSNFVFIMAYQLIILGMLLFCFSETLVTRRKLSKTHVLNSYKLILTNKHFIVCVGFLSVLMGYFSLFSILGPFLIQVTLQKSAIYYGKVALLMGLAWFLGNVFNRVLFRYDEGGKTIFSLVVMLFSSLCFVALSCVEKFTTLHIALPTFFMVLASGFIFPIYIGEALTIFPSELAASANGCLFSMTWLGFGIYTLIGALIKTNTPLPTAMMYLIIGILCIFLYLGILSIKKQHDAN